MSVEQNPGAPASAAVPASGIENEISTYRAISPSAVISIILGILGVLSFVDWSFLAFSALAIVLGVWADRKIRRYPDVLTGRNLAQFGIALGLVFGLAALTTGSVQLFIRRQAASTFARSFADVLKKGQVEDAFWYTRPPEARKDKSASDLYKEFKAQMRDPLTLQEQTGSLLEIKKRLSSDPKQQVHFSRIEHQGEQGLDVVATALLDLDGPPTKDFPQPEQFALLSLKARSGESKYEWWIENILFPYKPSTYVPAPAPVDDGHGHSH